VNGVRFPAGATPGRTRRPYAVGTSCRTLMAIRFRVQEMVAPCLHSCARTGTTLSCERRDTGYRTGYRVAEGCVVWAARIKAMADCVPRK